jgi:hypothetical protein
MTQHNGFFGRRTIPALARNVVVIAGLLLAAACGKGTTEPTHDDPIPDNPQPTETAIQVQNHSAYTLVDVYFSSCSATTYGEDRYTGALGPGESATFKDVSAGCYDIKAVTADDRVAEFRDQTVSTGQTTIVTVTN